MVPPPITYVNGRFWPAGAGGARALLAQAGRIVALDPPHWPSDARVIDLGGRAVIPGPVDSHCHLVSWGMQEMREADLRGAGSLPEIEARLAAHAGRLGLRPGDGRWLLGRGFEQDLLAEARWPTRADLDRLAPDRPLRITRVCGHALVANTAALAAAGLDPETRHSGLPEGVLTEEAQAPIYRSLPEPSPAEWRHAARSACLAAARAGFVGVHCLIAHGRELRALVELDAESPLPVRITMQLPYSLLREAEALGLRTGFGSETLTVGAIKLFSDGSLGARTAALHAPYSDDSGTAGELIYPPDELAERVRRVYEAGFQVCVHAIGDRAMDVTLDAISAAELEQAAAGRTRLWPPRIEHASLVNPEIVARMRRLGVAAAIQPQFAWSDYWAPERLGPERTPGCYAFRTLWEAGIPLAGGTDCPVERLDALAAIGNAVHRPDWSPGEALPLEATLRIFSEGAYALLGRSGGRLQPGDWADFVVLNRDPRAVEPAEVAALRPEVTVVAGHPVRPDQEPHPEAT
jgi:predicted amidohydrolase YtcJ